MCKYFVNILSNCRGTGRVALARFVFIEFLFYKVTMLFNKVGQPRNRQCTIHGCCDSCNCIFKYLGGDILTAIQEAYTQAFGLILISNECITEVDLEYNHISNTGGRDLNLSL